MIGRIQVAPSLAEMFSAAVEQLLKGEGRGGQVGLVQRLGVTKAYLNNMLSGRAGWPDHIMGICSKICPAKKPT